MITPQDYANTGINNIRAVWPKVVCKELTQRVLSNGDSASVYALLDLKSQNIVDIEALSMSTHCERENLVRRELVRRFKKSVHATTWKHYMPVEFSYTPEDMKFWRDLVDLWILEETRLDDVGVTNEWLDENIVLSEGSFSWHRTQQLVAVRKHHLEHGRVEIENLRGVVRAIYRDRRSKSFMIQLTARATERSAVILAEQEVRTRHSQEMVYQAWSVGDLSRDGTLLHAEGALRQYKQNHERNTTRLAEYQLHSGFIDMSVVLEDGPLDIMVRMLVDDPLKIRTAKGRSEAIIGRATCCALSRTCHTFLRAQPLEWVRAHLRFVHVSSDENRSCSHTQDRSEFPHVCAMSEGDTHHDAVVRMGKVLSIRVTGMSDKGLHEWHLDQEAKKVARIAEKCVNATRLELKMRDPVAFRIMEAGEQTKKNEEIGLVVAKELAESKRMATLSVEDPRLWQHEIRLLRQQKDHDMRMLSDAREANVPRRLVCGNIHMMVELINAKTEMVVPDVICRTPHNFDSTLAICVFELDGVSPVEIVLEDVSGTGASVLRASASDQRYMFRIYPSSYNLRSVKKLCATSIPFKIRSRGIGTDQTHEAVKTRLKNWRVSAKAQRESDSHAKRRKMIAVGTKLIQKQKA